MHAWSATQACLTLCNPMDCSLPGSSVHEISQAKILAWVAISFSRGSSQPRDQTSISWIGRWTLSLSHLGSPWKPHSMAKKKRNQWVQVPLGTDKETEFQRPTANCCKTQRMSCKPSQLRPWVGVVYQSLEERRAQSIQDNEVSRLRSLRRTSRYIPSIFFPKY